MVTNIIEYIMGPLIWFLYLCPCEKVIACNEFACVAYKVTLKNCVKRSNISIHGFLASVESFHLLTKLASETIFARTGPSLASSSIFTFWWAHLYKAICTFKSLRAITVPLKAGPSIIANNIFYLEFLVYVSSKYFLEGSV